MCVKTITAYQDSKGGMYPLEITAIQAEAAIVTGQTPATIKGLFEHAEALIPLLQRSVELAAPKSQDMPAPETAEKDPPKLTGAQLDRQGHASSCRARLTGYAKDCNCEREDED